MPRRVAIRRLAQVATVVLIPFLLGQGCPVSEPLPPDDVLPDDNENTVPAGCALEGLGSAPGDGEGKVMIVLSYEGDSGSVSVSPVLPGIEKACFTLGVAAQQILGLAECPEEIGLKEILFKTETGEETTFGTVTLRRGTDYACGTVPIVHFTPPCVVALQP